MYRFSSSNKNARRKNRESNQDDPGVGARNGIDRKCQNPCGETSAHKNPRSEIKSGIITRQPKSPTIRSGYLTLLTLYEYSGLISCDLQWS